MSLPGNVSATPGRPVGLLLPAAVAYEAVAEAYDGWHWQRFWERNEAPLVQQLLSKYGHDARTALEVGTGTGRYLERLSRCGIAATGLDTSRRMLEVAAQRAPRATLLLGSATALPLSTQYDVALSCRVLSHIQDLPSALAEITRVMRPGGVFVLSDLHSEHAYQYTRIPCGGASIYVDTYKWSLAQVLGLAQHSGLWDVLEAMEVRVNGLRWLPEATDFPALDRTGKRPVFYVAVLRRRADGISFIDHSALIARPSLALGSGAASGGHDLPAVA